jgi:hypothetical protein
VLLQSHIGALLVECSVSTERVTAALSLIVALPLHACFAVPVGLPDKQPFAEQQVSFLDTPNLSQDEIYKAFADFSAVTEGHQQHSWDFLVFGGHMYMGWAGIADLKYLQLLLLKFDETGLLTDYQASLLPAIQDYSGYRMGHCNDAGICKWKETYVLHASEEADEHAKNFDASGDSCFVYGLNQSDRRVKVRVDDLGVGQLINGELYAYWEVPPGRHKFERLHFYLSDKDRWMSSGGNFVEFDCKAGDRLFFSYDRIYRFFETPHTISITEQVPLDKGRKLIDKKHLVLMD